MSVTAFCFQKEPSRCDGVRRVTGRKKALLALRPASPRERSAALDTDGSSRPQKFETCNFVFRITVSDAGTSVTSLRDGATWLRLAQRYGVTRRGRLVTPPRVIMGLTNSGGGGSPRRRLRLSGVTEELVPVSLHTERGRSTACGRSVRTMVVCGSAADCSLNGICSVSTLQCVCEAPWTGPTCGKLNFRAAPQLSMYGYLPNVR